MEDVKHIIAENLTSLRKAHGLTQAQLAEKFNYSDKAICRWERGDTLPDINTLHAVAEFYGITLNDLVSPDFEAETSDRDAKEIMKYRVLVTLMLLCAVWLLTVVIFITTIAFKIYYWHIFIWAVPASCIATLKLWRGRALGYILRIIIYSIIVWTTITAVFLHLLVINGVNAWMLYLIGIPLELMVIFWQHVRKYRDRD